MKILLLFAAACTVVLGAIAYAEVERDALIATTGGDAARFGAALLSNGYQPADCKAEVGAGPNDRELSALMSAISTVETYARPQAGRTIKDQLALTLAAMGLPVPDWSLGPGEIRLSTAKKAIDAFGLEGQKPGVPRYNLVRLLVNSCTNFAIGKQVLRYIAARQGVDLTRLNRESISVLAADYNGQRTMGSLPEQASKLFYRDAVYHLFYAFLLSPAGYADERLGKA